MSVCREDFGGDGGEGGREEGTDEPNGEDDQSIFVVVIASGLASLFLVSVEGEGGREGGRRERQKSRQEEMEKMSDSSSSWLLDCS